jgi:cobalamin 5'-phosphate synthase/cobalamin synthase
MPGASVRAAAGAVSFLTRIPVGRLAAVDAADVARGAVVFPVVGAGVGAVSAGIALAAHQALPAFVAAVLAVAASALVTGALHLDALADTADASGALTRNDALAVMRDSRIGPFGAVALVLDLVLKVACVAVLLEHGHALGGLVAAGGLSRAGSLPLAAVLPYPRAEGGSGGVLTGRLSLPLAGVGVALGIGAAVVAWWEIWYWLAAGAAAVTVVLGLVFRRWLGGATGDCLGAATEVCETAVLVVASAFA